MRINRIALTVVSLLICSTVCSEATSMYRTGVSAPSYAKLTHILNVPSHFVDTYDEEWLVPTEKAVDFSNLLRLTLLKKGYSNPPLHQFFSLIKCPNMKVDIFRQDIGGSKSIIALVGLHNKIDALESNKSNVYDECKK